MYTGQDDHGVLLDPIPHDVREPPKKRTVIFAVSLRVGQRLIADTLQDVSDRFPKLGAETVLLSVVPILDRRLSRARPLDEAARVLSTPTLF